MKLNSKTTVQIIIAQGYEGVALDTLHAIDSKEFLAQELERLAEEIRAGSLDDELEDHDA